MEAAFGPAETAVRIAHPETLPEAYTTPLPRRDSDAIGWLFSTLSRWRALLTPRAIARHSAASQDAPSESVDRAVERILYLRLCEERGIEPFGRLRTTIHDLLPGVQRGGRIVLGILDDLYAVDRPYDFAALPPDILGRVYERSLTRDKECPSRKSGGVYYTPAPIVDYIVERTVGTLLERRREPDAPWKVRILDPACGGGSFLLGAYQRLLRWHLADRVANLEEGVDRGPAASSCEGQPDPRPPTTEPRHETIGERMRILREHIFGADIDPHAVEITKMSLVLTAFEGQTSANYCDKFNALAHGALRDLDANIKCGDSLIGPERGRDQPGRHFDWHASFPHVFTGESPGFAAVIGNPPWVSYSGRQAVEMPAAIREYLEQRYDATGWLTAHGLFIQRSVRDLSRRFTSFIVPDQVGHLDGYAAVRRAVAQHAGLVEVRYWGEDVFDGVVSPTLTFVADRDHRGETEIIDADGRRLRTRLDGTECWHVAGRDGGAPIELRVPTHSLGRLVADPGVHTGNCSKRLIFDASDTSADCVPILEGKQVSRYRCEPPTKALDLAYRRKDDEYFTIRTVDRYTDAPFVIRQTAGYPIVGPRRHADYFRNSLLALYPPTDGTDVRYLVGLLNSRLMRFLYAQSVRESRQKTFPQVKVRSLRALPIRTIDTSGGRDRQLHDRIVACVSTALEIQARADRNSCRTTNGDFEETIAEIDRLVFGLYALKRSEITTIKRAV